MVDRKDNYVFIEDLVKTKSVKDFKKRLKTEDKRHVKFIIEVICNLDNLKLTPLELKCRKKYLPLEKYFKNKTELDLNIVLIFLIKNHKLLRGILAMFLHHIYDSAVVSTCDC